MAALEAAKRQAPQVPRFLCRLAEAFDTLGVVYGSHGDADGETREYFSRIGASVSEFPTRRTAAALARAVGDPIVLGAPGVARDGPDGGNISTLPLIEDRLCDALASDQSHSALMDSAFRLVDAGVMDLPAAWAMISTRPADILRLPDRGVIDYGRRADLTVVNAATRADRGDDQRPGASPTSPGEAAQRFLGARQPRSAWPPNRRCHENVAASSPKCRARPGIVFPHSGPAISAPNRRPLRGPSLFARNCPGLRLRRVRSKIFPASGRWRSA